MITNCQIDEIEKFLLSAKLTDDYILELKDHLICEVEAEMESGQSFEAAFENTRTRWIPLLMPKTTFSMGLTNPFPTIMLKKATNIRYKNMLIGFVLAVILIAPYFWYRKEMAEATNIIFRLAVLLIAVGSSLFFTLRFRFPKQRFTTSIYSNLLRIGSYGPLVFFLSNVTLFGFLSNIDRLNTIDFNTLLYSAFIITGDTSRVDLFFMVFYIVFTIANIRLYYLHRKLIKHLQFSV